MCVALALTASGLMAQETMILRFTLRVSNFSFETQDGYDLIRSKDNRVAYLLDPGKPMLPVFVPTYIIPFWKTVSYCEVVSKDSVLVPGFWRIYPAQSSSDTSWVPPDSAVYYSDSLYPGIPTGKIDLGSFDGAVLARPQANVFQYRPLSGKLFLYTDITLKLVFKDSEPPINAKQRYPHVQEIYDDMLREFTENDGDIGAWYRRPAIIEPGSKTNPDVFAIITTENQMDEAEQYADWTDRRGYPTMVVDVNTITSSTPGRNNAEKVFNWIKDHYQLGLSFVMFLGPEDYYPFNNQNRIPYRYLYTTDTAGAAPPPPFGPLNWIPSDLYFSSVSCVVSPQCAGKPIWDCDEDGIYGEEHHDAGSYDNYPEVFVGRILSLESPNEAQNWLTKALKYEKDPGNTGSLTVVNAIVDGSVTLETQYNQTQAEYPQPPFTFNRLSARTASYVCAFLNNNPCGIVDIYGHGLPSLFYTYPPPQNPDPAYMFFSIYSPFATDLSDLTNQDRYFVAYGISCFQGAFDNGHIAIPELQPDTTPAEGFVEAYSLRGAVAFLGNTRTGNFGAPGNSCDLHRYYLDYLFGSANPQRHLIGVPEAYSRSQPSINCKFTRAHNLFCSPLTDIWTIATPPALTTQHPSSIPSGQQSFTVRVLSGLPLRGAMVSLKGCGVYVFDTTDRYGYVTFQINPQGPGTITVTATKHNYKPRESTCQVTGKGQMVSSEAGAMPEEVSLITSFTRSEIRIVYAIPQEDAGYVSLKVYDIAGREIKNLLDKETSPGWHELSWQAPHPGIWLVVLKTKTRTLTSRVVFTGGD